MNKNVIIGLLALIIVAGAAFLLGKNSDKMSPRGDDGIIINNVDESGERSGSDDPVRRPPALPN